MPQITKCRPVIFTRHSDVSTYRNLSGYKGGWTVPYRTGNDWWLDCGLLGGAGQGADEQVQGAGQRVHPPALAGPVQQGGVQTGYKLLLLQLHHELSLIKQS
jgi:hypothetical protein